MTEEQLIPKHPAVILTGGAEIITVSLAEELSKNHIPIVLISLGIHSIIRRIPGVIAYHQISWPPNECTILNITNFLKKIGAGNPHPWPIFCTEDSGCRFLFKNQSAFNSLLTIFGARNLSMKGLDKSEFFSYLESHGCQDIFPETITLSAPDEIKRAFKKFGNNFILKPSLKPFTMNVNLGSRGTKILFINEQESPEKFIRRCQTHWSISTQWVAQKKLLDSPTGECLWYGLRSAKGETVGLTAIERWKYPKNGGTGCWVESQDFPELHNKAKRVLSVLDFHGIAEIDFLKDESKEWKILELNPRPWLQIALAAKAGYPLIQWLYSECSLNFKIIVKTELPRKIWINPERMFLAALSGEYGPRLKSLNHFLSVFINADYRSIYDCPFNQVKAQWMFRMLKKIFSL